jgi:hypothetical protein
LDGGDDHKRDSASDGAIFNRGGGSPQRSILLFGMGVAEKENL